MAEDTRLIGQPNLAEQFMRALGIKGDLPGYVSALFQPGITSLDLTTAEFLWLRRTTRLSQGINLGAVAGQFSQAVFSAMAGTSGTLCLIESVVITNNTAGPLNYRVDLFPSAITAPAAIPKTGLDDRSWPGITGSQPVPGFGWSDATAAAGLIGTGAQLVSVPASSVLVLPLNAVLTARTLVPNIPPLKLVLCVQNTTLNSTMQVGAFWSERTLQDSEAL